MGAKRGGKYRKSQVAKYKLDWFFVKADIGEFRAVGAAFLFAPHFARTPVNPNNCRPKHISADALCACRVYNNLLVCLIPSRG